MSSVVGGSVGRGSVVGKEKLQVGIVGCGGIARAHALAYNEDVRVELVGVVDIDHERSAAFAQKYETTAYDSIGALLGQHPDLVSVATPPGSHAEVAIELLSGGVSVLVEKPPTPTLAELDAVAAVEAVSAGNVHVVFQHRHGSGARRAHELLRSGALGAPRVTVCETLWYRPDSYYLPDWRGNWAGEGGGPTLGHGIHQIDLLLHLMGEWSQVTAQAARIARPVEFEDVSIAMITFASGAVGTVVTSLLSPRELSRIRIDTTMGTLEVDHVYGYRDADWSWTPLPDAEVAARLGHDPGIAGAGGEAPVPSDGGDVWLAATLADRPSNHAAQIHRLVDDLLAGRTHETTLASTRSTIELVTALYASSFQRRTVRRGDLGPAHPFYDRLDGGLPADTISAQLATSRS